MKRNEEEGIYKILPETEPIINNLCILGKSYKGTNKRAMISIGILASKRQDAILIDDKIIQTKKDIKILYKTPKNLVIQIKENLNTLI